MDAVYPIADQVTRCNQKCVFCCNLPEVRGASRDQLKKLLVSGTDTLRIGLWEPTLDAGLPDLVRYAHTIGFKHVIVRTNGIRLSDPKLVRELLDAGVDMFHINIPSHLPALADSITRTKGSHKRRLQGIRNLIDAGAANKIFLVYVINSMNLRTMEQFAAYVAKEMPGICSILFGMICVLGPVNQRLSLVPRFSEVAPFLAAAMRACRAGGVRFSVDDVPICHMKGFEDASVDYRILRHSPELRLEKIKAPRCAGCALGKDCAGVRPQHLELYGDGELRPVKKR